MEKSRGGWASLTSCTEARQRVAVEALEVCSFPTAARREESLLVVLLGGRHGRAVLRSARPSVLPALIGGLPSHVAVMVCFGLEYNQHRIGYIMITDAEKGSSSQSRWRENCKTHEFLEERMQRNMREIHSIQDVAGSLLHPHRRLINIKFFSL